MTALLLACVLARPPQAPALPQAPAAPPSCNCGDCPCGCQGGGTCTCSTPDADGWRKTRSGPHRWWRYAPAAPTLSPAMPPPALMYQRPAFFAPQFPPRGGNC